MMLAQNADKAILKSKDHIFEPKIDGYRAYYILAKGEFKLITRNGNDITNYFPHFDFIKNIKAKECKLDGEIAIFNEQGNPSFSLMQRKAQDAKNAIFIVFDILERNGKDLKLLPIEKRKEILAQTLIENQYLQLMPFTDNGVKLWTEISKRSLEGIMAKKKGSLYLEKRTSEWLKIKKKDTLDCVIIGITQKKRAISSLALGLYDNNILKFIGKVGTGFSEKLLKQLGSLLIRTSTSTLKPIIGALPKDIIPVIPDTVCEVGFLELTPNYKLRAPVFIRLREDKSPQQCLFDQFKLKEPIQKLTTYKNKRNFTQTLEPQAELASKPLKIKPKNPSLIYVIQKHYATRLHYDFRLEYQGVLLSWAIPKGMPQSNEKRLGIMTEDHPLSYAKFQGIIPEGNYGAGKVEIWDEGKYVNITVKNDHPLELNDAIRKGHFNVYLKGKKLQGTFSFVRMEDKNWLITKKADETQDNTQVHFTHLDKCLDKGVIKKDLIDYYEKIWHLMLPHIKERALTLFRFPSGIDKEKFFQKHSPDYFPDYIPYKEITHKGKTICYPVVNNKDGILYLANQVSEIHIMTSKINKIELPDKIVFDLDPIEVELKALKNTAKKFKSFLEELGLTPFIMATGGNGYHVVAPIKPELKCSEVRNLAFKIAETLANSDPDLLTTEISKSKRKGKIFIDVNRNSSMQTSIAPYSVRARKGITIAAPLFWEDLSKVAPNSFTVKNYKIEDPWKDFFSSSASLKKLIKDLKQ